MGAPTRHGVWAVRGRDLPLDRPLLMGILNATPDSFSDGGRYDDPDRALAHADSLLGQGADLLDLGGESTRPGADPVPETEELRRVLPIIERLAHAHPGIPLSIDTRRASVAREALAAGASIVNDVSGLDDPRMAAVVAEAGAGLVLMHMRGTPRTMRSFAQYRDVVGEVADELSACWSRAREAGIPDAAIALDPGIGFAKTGPHNLEILARLPALAALGRPLLLGPSRKAFLGELLGGAPPDLRVNATAAACVVGLLGGARIFRVHDVKPVREALIVAESVRRSGEA
jgi:dihydropteroate synthase